MILTEYNQKYNHLTLSATFDADSFFYCLWGDHNELITCGNHEGFEYIRQNYRIDKLVLSCSCLPFTHVPLSEYDDSAKASYLEQIARTNNLSTWTYSSNKIGNYGISTVFAYQEKTLEKYNILKDEPKLIHKSSALIWSNLMYTSDQASVFVNIKDNCCSLSVASGDQLLFYNQFAFKTKEDILYYCILTFDQLHLDRNSNPLILSGDVAEDSPLYKILFNYIAHICFDKIEFSCDESIIRPKHFFTDHYALISCV